MKGILDEPPCRASMKNSGNKRMIERKRSWKHKVNPCNDLDGASRQYNRENLELRKRKDETLETRITSSWTISERKELNHLEEIRIRFIVCLSFIKLNWWQAMDFAYYLFFLKRIEKWHIANLRRSSWTTGRIRKNEWIKMIIKEKESWTNHRKNSKMTDERDWITRKN